MTEQNVTSDYIKAPAILKQQDAKENSTNAKKHANLFISLKIRNLAVNGDLFTVIGDFSNWRFQ